MTFIAFHLLAYILCFVLIWFAAGQIVSAVITLSNNWRLPAFTVSFFILGFMTSLPEMAIGTAALFSQTPHIFAGNLLGAMIVVLLLIIPLLSIIGNGVRFPSSQINHPELLAILTVVATPAFLAADQRITTWEGWFMVLIYVAMASILTFQHSIFERVRQMSRRPKPISMSVLGTVLLSVFILFFASRQIVTSTLFFAEALSLSPFLVSLFVVALGTNIPEFSIIFRALLAKRSEIALADYLGSASANTFLFGILTVLYGQTFTLPGQVGLQLIFLLAGLLLFFVFARSKNTLSRKEGLVLLTIYCVFVVYEMWQSGFLAQTRIE